MDGLLTPMSNSYIAQPRERNDALVEVISPPVKLSKAYSPPSTPAEALEILRTSPDHESLISTLRYLTKETNSFEISSPSPLAAQLVYILVSEIVPNYWDTLKEEADRSVKTSKKGSPKNSSELALLLSSIRSVTGLNAVLLALRRHIQQSKEVQEVGGPKIQDLLTTQLRLLLALLEGSDTVALIWDGIQNTSAAPLKQKAVWNEFLGLIAGGKVLGVSAEAEEIINGLSENVGERYWIANGSQFSTWLAKNVSHWATNLPLESDRGWKGCGELLSKAARLGYSENLVKDIIVSLLLHKDHCARFKKIIATLSPPEQRNFLYSVLKIASKEHFSAIVTTEVDPQWWHTDARIISAVAGLISLVVANEDHRKSHLVSWLTGSFGAGIGDGIAIRRSAVAVLSADKTVLETVLDKSLQQFGDQLYIRHTPTMQQEAHAQVLILTAGYIHRIAPLRLTLLMRAGSHLRVVSNRLGASSARARFLGMVVGEALSSLVDKDDSKMDFKIEEMTTAEALWYKSLAFVSDTIGSPELLRSSKLVMVPKEPQSRGLKQVPKPKAVAAGSKIMAIKEVEDEDEMESEDEGLVPYSKPDSDAEDSDEDPTLITRNKHATPVYIRDLITYLRNTEDYDRQKLGLSTAASLIRRKANFGTEVSTHAEELATLLVGLQDKYELENFNDMRLQGMIAILVASPINMGQWFAKTFFDGDYSLSQRASILTTLGLGARELGGFSTEDVVSKPATLSNTSFPSKTLPSTVHRFYAPTSTTSANSLQHTPISTLSTALQNAFIAPVATTLADKHLGPNILKTRTFSSRMAVEAARLKPTTNALSKIVSTAFFFPLTGRFFVHLKAYGSSRSNVVFQPFLLAHFLKTLALILHASGPNTLSLPQMTSELWDLLLGLRTQSVSDASVLEALLFAFLTLLEVNEDKRRLVESQGRQLLETQEWVTAVLENLGKGGDEEERVRMLAAGVLVRIRECVEKYQGLLTGVLLSF